MKPLFIRFILPITLISFTGYYTPMYSAIAGASKETLLEHISPHKLTKRLSHAIFDNNIEMTKSYIIEAGADPNAAYQTNTICNNRLTRSLANCCSSETKHTISTTSYIYPLLLMLSGVICAMVTLMDCAVRADRFENFCIMHPKSSDFYCYHKPSKTWAQFCKDPYLSKWCKQVFYEYGKYCSNHSNYCLCDPITKQHEPWINSCVRFRDKNACHTEDLHYLCETPPTSPCSYSSTTFTLETVGISTPILIASVLLYRLNAKAAGKDSCWWKKKFNYVINSKTPLMIATLTMNPSQPENKQIIQLLLEHKAHLDTTDKHGNTALMHAARAGNIPAIETLCLAGANIDLKNNYGHTALARATPEALHIIRTIQEAYVLKHLSHNNSILTQYIPVPDIVHTIIDYILNILTDTHDASNLLNKYYKELPDTHRKYPLIHTNRPYFSLAMPSEIDIDQYV